VFEIERASATFFFLPMLSFLRCCGSRSGGSASASASAFSRAACSLRHRGLVDVIEIGSQLSRPYSSSKWEAASTTKGSGDDANARALAALVADLLRSSSSSSSPGAAESAAAALSSQLRPAERRHLMAALAGAELRSGATDAVVATAGGAAGARAGAGNKPETLPPAPAAARARGDALRR